MIFPCVVLFSVFSVYVCCCRPAWVWTTFVSTSVLIGIAGSFLNVNVSSIYFGSITLRAADPATLGILVGIAYHLYHGGLKVFRGRPLLWIVGAILAFFVAKVAWTVLLGEEQIAANPTASHALGGLVAALGELRDDMICFVLPVYAYVARRSCNLPALGLPTLAGACVIVAKGLLFIAVTHQIWSDSADYRFLNAEEATSLTLFCFLLFFLRVSRVSPVLVRTFALLALAFAFVANHRSQWLGATAGLAVLTTVILLGRPFVGNQKANRLLVSGFGVLVVLGAMLLSTLTALADRFPIVSVLAVRLYAITQPGRDADAKWRAALWHDRIQQVGDDWPWGRLLGDRRATLFHGHWLTMPDHSAYVSTYELGGVVLCVLVGLFWLRVMYLAGRQLGTKTSREEIWPAAVALAICATALAFGSGYDFPVLAPSLSLVLLLGSGRYGVNTRFIHARQTSWTCNRASVSWRPL